MGFSGFMRPILGKILRMRLSEKIQLLRAHAFSLHATTGPQSRVLIIWLCLLHRLHLNPVEVSDIVVNVISFQYSKFFIFARGVFLRQLV